MSKLEQLAQKYLPKEFVVGMIDAFDVKLDVTPVPPASSDIVFKLESAGSGSITKIKTQTSSENGAVVRWLLTDTQFSNTTDFQFRMYSILNEALKEITKTIGSLAGRTVYLTQPGSNGNLFFRDNHPQYELRIYVAPKDKV